MTDEEIIKERKRQQEAGAKLMAELEQDLVKLKDDALDYLEDVLNRPPERHLKEHKHNTIYERARIKCDCGVVYLTQLAVELCEGRGHQPLEEKP